MRTDHKWRDPLLLKNIILAGLNFLSMSYITYGPLLTDGNVGRCKKLPNNVAKILRTHSHLQSDINSSISA